MKKIMFALALTALISFGAQAQKQMGDEHNIEVSFTPFGSDVIDGTTIKYRNFVEDNRAFRLSLILQSTMDTYVTYQEGDFSEEDPVSPQLHDFVGSSSIGIAPGYEFHFDGTDRVSPYFGIEAFFLRNNNTYEVESWGPNDVDNIGQLEKNVTWSVKYSQGSNAFGLNFVTGADFYFTDAMYLGFEAGLGLSSTNVTNYEYEISDLVAYNLATGQAQDADAPVAIVGLVSADDLEYGYLSSFELGNMFQASLRVGFLFD